MKKLLTAVILHALLLPVANAQARLLDQRANLKTCNISVKANRFIATTFIEMEFYNPKDVEVEAVHRFSLNKGQVITAFQLDLNGKYRNASIEERWKASRAYNSIVGKRVDPAIIQMDYQNNYTINIYPVPAHGSRKVTMTIDQLLLATDSMLEYYLPMNISTITDSFNLKVNVENCGSSPFSKTGVLKDRQFNFSGSDAEISLSETNIFLNQAIAFSIPFVTSIPAICVSKENGISNFIVRLAPGIPEYYPVTPKTVSVFWDVSASSSSRNIKAELNFLEQYILENNIKTASITLFNQAIQQKWVIETKPGNLKAVNKYLLEYNYNGATMFGNLDLSVVTSDVILIFSDGFNTFGKALPKSALVQVICIVSANYNDIESLNKIISVTGGSVVYLNKASMKVAYKKTEMAQNFLMKYTSTGGSVKMNDAFPVQFSKNMLLSGTFNGNEYLQLFFGNTGTLKKVREIFLDETENCDPGLFKKLRMLHAYDNIVYSSNWKEMVYFGLNEKVVTPQTAFLVLERIEDYINYKIAPPEELVDECAKRNYVYKSEYKIRSLKKLSDQDGLQTSVNYYNLYLKWWNSSEEPIDLEKIHKPVTSTTGIAQTEQGKPQEIAGNNPGINPGTNSIKEVIVTSAFQTKRTLRSQSSNVQTVNAEQLNIIRGADINNALAGKVAGMQVRSQSSVKLGYASSIRLRGENGLSTGTGPIYVLDGTVIADPGEISIDDIESITVLQGPAAAALFGPDGSNGAIVLTGKRARRSYSNNQWRSYKLKDMEEMDYMEVIKIAEDDELWKIYKLLEKSQARLAGFYFDMADYFHERKQTRQAFDILFNGIELCRGNANGLKAAAFMFEKWKCFREAIDIYKDICEKNPRDLGSLRNLALAYFQHGEYQLSVNTYYEIIKSNESDIYMHDEEYRVIAINEMNAVISQFKEQLNIGLINPNLVRTLPVDLNISVESNNYNFSDLRIAGQQGNQLTTDNKYIPVTYYKSRHYWYYDNFISGHSIRNAAKGLYKLKINAYDYYYYQVPVYLRVIIFRKFQQCNQVLEVQYIAMDNQYGNVEVATFRW